MIFLAIHVEKWIFLLIEPDKFQFLFALSFLTEEKGAHFSREFVLYCGEKLPYPARIWNFHHGMGGGVLHGLVPEVKIRSLTRGGPGPTFLVLFFFSQKNTQFWLKTFHSTLHDFGK